MNDSESSASSEHQKIICSPSEKNFSEKLLEIENNLAWKLTSFYFGFKFNSPVEYVYNPLEYACDVHSNYVKRYCNTKKILLFLGMNPGPWGMVQTGVPFGDVNSVKDWLKLSGNIKEPVHQHPLKKVKGFECKRIEVSGKRFWSLAQHLSENNPYNFFSNSFVYNYFPLVLLSTTGKNITPADLKASDQKLLQNICDESLLDLLHHLETETVIAIGRFSEKRVTTVLKNKNISNIKVVYISHPSPRNPESNKDWLGKTLQQFGENDLIKHFR